MDVDVVRLRSVVAPELPDDVALAVVVLVGDEGGAGALAGFEVEMLDPGLVHDLLEEILGHAPMSEEEPVAEVVLSHDFSAGTLP